MWETTELRECFRLRGKTFCENCWGKLLDKHPELGELDFEDSGSTWQIPDPEPKVKIRIPWKAILSETFEEKSC